MLNGKVGWLGRRGITNYYNSGSSGNWQKNCQDSLSNNKVPLIKFSHWSLFNTLSEKDNWERKHRFTNAFVLNSFPVLWSSWKFLEYHVLMGNQMTGSFKFPWKYLCLYVLRKVAENFQVSLVYYACLLVFTIPLLMPTLSKQTLTNSFWNIFSPETFHESKVNSKAGYIL